MPVYLLKLHCYVAALTAQHLINHHPDHFGTDSEIVTGYTQSGGLNDELLQQTLTMDYYANMDDVVQEAIKALVLNVVCR